jgi:hypothetical protein
MYLISSYKSISEMMESGSFGDINRRQVQYFINQYYKGTRIKGAVKNMYLYDASHFVQEFLNWHANRLSISERNKINRSKRRTICRSYKKRINIEKTEDQKRIDRFGESDLIFFRSWNRRRPEKFMVDLETFSVMGLKIKKGLRGRYILGNRMDLSDLWYGSPECKALHEFTGSSTGIVHFLNVVNWK